MPERNIIRMTKLDMINLFYLLISFVNVMGKNEELDLESNQLLTQLPKAPETKYEEVTTQQAVESDSEATRKNTEDLTNKIPCLDKSAKYRARPDKVRTVGSFIKSGPFFVSVG